MRQGSIYEMPAVRQERRAELSSFFPALIYFGDAGENATGGGYASNSALDVSHKKKTITAPVRAAKLVDLADGLWPSCCQVDTLQPRRVKICDRFTVRRPIEFACSFSSHHRRCNKRIELSNP